MLGLPSQQDIGNGINNLIKRGYQEAILNPITRPLSIEIHQSDIKGIAEESIDLGRSAADAIQEEYNEWKDFLFGGGK